MVMKTLDLTLSCRMLKNGQKWFKKYVSKYVQIFKVCLVIFLVITHERVKAHYLVKSTHEFSCEMPIFWRFFRWYVMLCTISYLIHNLKNVKSTHAGVLILVKLQGLVAGFTFLKFSNGTKSCKAPHMTMNSELQ